MGPFNTYGDTDEVAALKRESLGWQRRAQELTTECEELRKANAHLTDTLRRIVEMKNDKVKRLEGICRRAYELLCPMDFRSRATPQAQELMCDLRDVYQSTKEES